MCGLLFVSYIVCSGSFHKRFFHHKSMENSFGSPPSCNEVIALKFWTRQDSFAKFSSDMKPYNGVTLKPIFQVLSVTAVLCAVSCFIGLCYNGFCLSS